MKTDPGLEEVRLARRRISEKFGHDIRKLGAHYMEIEETLRKTGEYRFAETKATPDSVLHDKPEENK